MHRFLAFSSMLALSAGMAHAEMTFNRVASFPTPANMADGEDRARPSSSEIIAASEDGMMLAYTDSPLGALGLIDIADPAAPKPLGAVAMGGEPTSVAIIGTLALVGVNTSESYASPSGKLVSVDLATKAITAECDLGGQPDSVARSKDGGFVVVAIENERDEDLNDGVMPQMPAGQLAMVKLKDGAVDCASLTFAAVTGLAEIAPEDPEPEFVAVNDLGETVLTMQENNHLVVIGPDGAVIAHFSAGMADLENIDVDDEKASLDFTTSLTDVKREPDGAKWIDNDHFAIANEGDYEGGSRSWSIFKKDGTVVYESGSAFEHAVIAAGHYPDRRSDAKGAEPESIEVGVYDGVTHLFVASERGSIIGVYDVSDLANPVLKQLLPSGISPEGMVAIPQRNLFVTANEVDLIEDGGVRSHVMIYSRSEAPAAYPQITSAGADKLIGWGALSGLVADAETAGRLYAVNDSFYGFQPTIFTIDATAQPAKITSALGVTRAGRPAQKVDMEGITLDGDGGFWIASEGDAAKLVAHAIYNVNAKGEIKAEIAIPAELSAHATRFGFEGITRIGDTLWMPMQREWKDDAKGMVKLVSYNIESKEWGAVRYPIEAPAEGAWVGLSDMVAHGDWLYVVERDNQIGDKAALKSVYRVAVSQLVATPLDGNLPVVTKELVRDLIPDLKALNGYIIDKVEGLAIDVAGNGFVVTDNDGVDDSSGETLFFGIGNFGPASN